MPRHVARYIITNGLAGGYMLDSSGPMEFATRRELASYIRGELERLDWPASLFKEVRIRYLWSTIARHGSSSMHFRIYHEDYVLAFHGLTDEEFEAEKSKEDY